jgi:2-C-methyl-D-erythritol 4-phosphate cytidylyltransferase
MNKTIVMIPAGGKGSRFGSEIPKQYHELAGIPVIIRTVSAFAQHGEIDKIVVNIDPSFEVFFKTQCEKYLPDMAKIELLTCPGKERQDTVLNALLKSESVKGVEIVLVHDAVRPFLTEQLISNIISAARKYEAVCPGVIPKNTIKEVDKEGIAEFTPKRASLREIQTPQGFRKGMLIAAYLEAESDGYFGTDSASLIEYIGEQVRVIDGEDNNFKITTPLDFITATALLTEE